MIDVLFNAQTVSAFLQRSDVGDRPLRDDPCGVDLLAWMNNIESEP